MVTARNDGNIVRTFVVEANRGQRKFNNDGVRRFKVAEYVGAGPSGEKPIDKKYLTDEEFVTYFHGVTEMHGWSNYRIMWDKG